MFAGRGGGRGRGGYGRDPTIMRLQEIQEIQGPTHELPPIDTSERRFSGRSRLYIGNIPNGMTEEKLKELVGKFGEVGEMFFNEEKHFAFLRMDFRENAEKAKRELDGQMFDGRNLKMRFAPHQGALKIKNLGPWVTNELLHRAFSVFGDIERAVVLVDDRGRSKGEGIVEYERKPSAMDAFRRCSEGCFFLTASLRPVIVEQIDECEDEDGLQEKMIPKRSQEFGMEREIGPRFAEGGSFEFEYGQKWKQLYEMKNQKIISLEREMKLEEDKLIAQMEYARYEHETEQLRQQLSQREMSRDRNKSMWEAREEEMNSMWEQEQQRRSEEEKMMMERMKKQEDTLKQRQEENSLFMQAQELNSILDQQESNMGGFGGKMGGMGMGMGGFDDEMMGGGFGGFRGGAGGGKRRRF